MQIQEPASRSRQVLLTGEGSSGPTYVGVGTAHPESQLGLDSLSGADSPIPGKRGQDMQRIKKGQV